MLSVGFSTLMTTFRASAAFETGARDVDAVAAVLTAAVVEFVAVFCVAAFVGVSAAARIRSNALYENLPLSELKLFGGEFDDIRRADFFFFEIRLYKDCNKDFSS